MMAELAGPVRVTLSAHQRFWFRPALSVLSFACAVVSIVSMHAAHWVSDKGCIFLARYGVKIRAE